MTALALWTGWGDTVPAAALGDEIKIAFLYNFAKFVEWPEQAPANGTDHFTICLVGDDEIVHAADRMLRDKQVQGRQVETRGLHTPDEARICHILFLDYPQIDLAKQAWRVARTMPILTVGESEPFLRSGGIIKFVTEDGKLRFEISTQAAARVHLKISSKLLKLGRIVEDP